MTIATKNGAIIVKDGKPAENCGCCEENCVCPERCTIGMQFTFPSEADIGVCGPSCTGGAGGSGRNPACPDVVNTISDTGIEDSPGGRVIISYTTTLNVVSDSTNFINGITKSYTRLFLDDIGFRSSIYATSRYAFVYQCSNNGDQLPILFARTQVSIRHYPGHSIGNSPYGGRSFARRRDFVIDPSAYKCSPAAGRMCPNTNPLVIFNPSATKEFLPEMAVFNFSQDGINDMPFNSTSSNQFGDQTLVSEVYDAQFSGFTATLVLSERNICNPLP